MKNALAVKSAVLAVVAAFCLMIIAGCEVSVKREDHRDREWMQVLTSVKASPGRTNAGDVGGPLRG